MNAEKKRLSLPVIVEGRYDKCALSAIFSGLIISLDGFSVFNSKEKQTLIRRVAEKGVIVLTDSDGGGRQLRSFLSGILPPDKVFNVYIPKIAGKERRKTKPSKEGLLGVEGMKPKVLYDALSAFTEEGKSSEGEAEREITSAEFYEDGFSGGENSSEKRRILAERLGLAGDISAKALLKAINVMQLSEEYEKVKKMKF